MSRPSVYLASPLGFAESTRAFMQHLATELSAYVDVINPWDDQRFAEEFVALAAENDWAKRTARLAEINAELGRKNAAGIERADGLFAVLDGVDVDSGTAAEIGYAAAKGKFVAGLRTDFRLAGDNHGSLVNLQVEYFIVISGGRVVSKTEDLLAIARDYAESSGTTA
ncbi:MAG: nucleoside 2-deoxyribosyltransferase [Thermomicrobiales bacterium]